MIVNYIAKLLRLKNIILFTDLMHLVSFLITRELKYLRSGIIDCNTRIDISKLFE